MKLFNFILMIAPILLFCECSNKELASSTNEILIKYNTKSLNISNQLKYESIWTQVTQKDPNSGETLTYSGYFLDDLLIQLKQIFNFESLSSIEIKARDGYSVEYLLSDLKQRKAFLALDVKGVSTKGIYNKSLNHYFNWRPGYLIFLKPDSLNLFSSPYQIVEIKLSGNEFENLILTKTPKKLHTGAKVFIKTCNKCHNYQGIGGIKAPAINFITSRWQDNKEFKEFLKQPQKKLGRKIEMSGFKGSSKDLENLINFLRFIEVK
jgi:cytochrome c2